MIQKVTDVVLIITGFQLILLAVVLLTQKNVKKLSRNLLVAFLLSKAFLIIRWFILQFDILRFENHIYFFLISSSGFLLLAPLLYLYIKSLCFKDFTIKKPDFLHLIPFVFLILYNTVSSYILSSDTYDDSNILYSICIINHGKIFWTSNLIQILFYIIAMFRILNTYQVKLRDQYSSIEKINLNWLHSLLVLIILHWLFVTSRSILSNININNEILLSLLDLFSITIFLVYTTILVIKGLGQLKIFPGIKEYPKYATSKLTNTDIEKYGQQLILIMQTQKPYLSPTLTIDDLSEMLSIPVWHLSQVINEYFNQNFFNFVNGFRIEEAKQLLLDISNGKKTVLEILYEVGFNSKSAFNTAFKKHARMTPTEYKNSHQLKLVGS